MARHAQDREDLLRDAKALVDRIEIQIEDEIIFAGFRKNGALSLYFDQDPAYHFNSDRQIRRAYWENRLIKAEQCQLVTLNPSRSETAVDLVRHEMTTVEQQRFCAELLKRLQTLSEHLQQTHFAVNGMVPKNSNILTRLKNWLNQFSNVQIAETPRVS